MNDCPHPASRIPHPASRSPTRTCRLSPTASAGGWSDTDALGGQELAGAAQLTVAYEDVPSLVEVLLVHEIAEPAECALALDRPLQPLP